MPRWPTRSVTARPIAVASREYRGAGVALTSPATDADTLAYDGDSKTVSATKGRYANTVTFAYDDAGDLASESLTTGGRRTRCRWAGTRPVR